MIFCRVLMNVSAWSKSSSTWFVSASAYQSSSSATIAANAALTSASPASWRPTLNVAGRGLIAKNAVASLWMSRVFAKSTSIAVISA